MKKLIVTALTALYLALAGCKPTQGELFADCKEELCKARTESNIKENRWLRQYLDAKHNWCFTKGQYVNDRERLRSARLRAANEYCRDRLIKLQQKGYDYGLRFHCTSSDIEINYVDAKSLDSILKAKAKDKL